MVKTLFGPEGWLPTRLRSLAGKTYVITGATAGIGVEAVRMLLQHEAYVVMLNRNPAKSSKIIAQFQQEFGADVAVRAIEMDLSNLESVRSAATTLLHDVPKIDALICNAAIAQVPKQVKTQDGFESQLGTNHFGHFVLAGMLFDRIDASAGRIVVVASLGYKMGLRTIQFDDLHWDKKYSANAAYSQSKLAQMMFAYALQDRIAAAQKSVKVYVCHPGASATSLIKTSGNRLTRAIVYVMNKTPLVQTAKQGAYPQIMCATEDGLEQRAFYGPTRQGEWKGPVGIGTLAPYALDNDVMVRLWARSEQETGFTWDLPAA